MNARSTAVPNDQYVIDISQNKFGQGKNEFFYYLFIIYCLKFIDRIGWM